MRNELNSSLLTSHLYLSLVTRHSSLPSTDNAQVYTVLQSGLPDNQPVVLTE
jgi:hypothetical protein